MPRPIQPLRLLGLCAVLCLWSPTPSQAGEAAAERPSVRIPRLEAAPTLEDFLAMEPTSDVARAMTRVDDFRQMRPHDGEPASERTEAYLGYDRERLYVVFVCFDSQPDRIRARLSRREDNHRDDGVDVFLDTFDDQTRAYGFNINALGVQRDGAWVERGALAFDESFDMVWDSRGTLTPEGFVVWIAIPFESLRFSPQEEQEWGLILGRWLRREDEGSFWPHISTRIKGRLNQEGSLRGIFDVSSGRNLQLIPYGFFRSFRALDQGADGGPRYVSDAGDLAAGLDVKRVFRDSLVLDATVNPDFSQVESDEPQVTVNERFEVFFPEKRPFFLENASFFETPINLFFSRRIVDPRAGGRVTGRAGRWSVGALYADDRAAGSQLSADDPLFGAKTQNGVFRLSRDLGNQSNLGLIYTESRLDASKNQVGGLDARVRLARNWVTTLQGVASSTRSSEGDEASGSAVDVVLERTGRQLSYSAAYNDRSPDFDTALGFLPGSRGPGRPGRPRTRALLLRRDFRGLRQTLNYRFRPEGDVLVAWGPDVTFHPSWRHDGSPLDTLYSVDLTAELTARSFAGAFYTGLVERLRPDEAFPDLLDETRYSSSRQGVFVGNNYTRSFNLSGEYAWGTVINLVPPEGEAPGLANSRQANVSLTWFATRSIRLEGAYLFSRVSERSASRTAFDNHIVRGRLSWQPTPRLTLRSIVQYDSLVTDPSLTSLETTRNLNVDVLATYLVNPWTAFYVGYNNNRNNLRLGPTAGLSELVRTDRLGADSWQFFVKASYLFRF